MAKRIDRNQPEIVRALRKAGCFVISTHEIGGGFPDLTVARAGSWFLLEVKDGMQKPSAQRLTPAESEFHSQAKVLAGATVHVVRTPEEALKAIGLL